MKKLIVVIFCLVMVAQAGAQIYMTTTGKVQFFSETPLENISALNSTVSSLINVTTDSVMVRMKNTGFVFKNALMQDHFNENYMESTKYPTDSFRGKINEKMDFKTDATHPVTATGALTIHGVTKLETIKGVLSVKGSVVHLETEFMVHTADFKIEVPKLVFEKIAEDIKVTMAADYKLKK